jgi:polyketide synthase PksN
MMIDQELIRDLTESYLKSVISEVAGRPSSDFDSLAPFGELGIDSFYVLKIIRRLEADFGRLPKSLLFENFNITDLASYFVGKHEQTLAAKFAERLQGGNGNGHGSRPDGGRQPASVPSRPAAAPR